MSEVAKVVVIITTSFLSREVHRLGVTSVDIYHFNKVLNMNRRTQGITTDVDKVARLLPVTIKW